MPTVEREGVRIHYDATGGGSVVLLTHGFSASSHVFAGDVRAAKIPGATLAVIADAGHAPNVSSPQAFARHARAFLDGLPVGRARR